MIPMSLSGRTTRWEFFLGGLLMLALAVVPVGFGTMFFVACTVGNGAGTTAAGGLFGLTAIAYLWVCLALHVRRIRDIGWDPLLVAAVWIGAEILDFAVAWRMPHLALSDGSCTTGFSGVIQTGLVLCLLLWPSGEARPTRGAPPSASPPPRPRRLEMLTRSGGSRAPISGSFGRR